MTVSTTNRIKTFTNSCLRRILQRRLPDTINNTNLWQRTSQFPIEEENMRRRLKWMSIGHNITRQALSWNLQGNRKGGRSRNTWRRYLEADIKRMGKHWKDIENIAQNRGAWRNRVTDQHVCPKRGSRHKKYMTVA